MPQRQVKVRNINLSLLEVLASENSVRELRSYLQAIQSYGDQLVNQPDLDFQQHLANVIYAEYRTTHASAQREN